MASSEKEPRYMGCMHPATAVGFKTIIRELNMAADRGYSLRDLFLAGEYFMAILEKDPSRGKDPQTSSASFFE